MSNTSLPMIYGYLASRAVPLPGYLGEKGSVLYRHGGAALFREGAPADLRCEEADGSFRCLWGRIYGDAPELPSLDPSAVQGSFLFISFEGRGEEQSLRLATDHYGFRRLLYIYREGVLYFSTRLRGLRMMIGGSLGLCEEALLHSYAFGFTPGDLTLVEGVRKLRAGSELCFRGGKVSLTVTRDLSRLYRPRDYRDRREEDIRDELDGIVAEAVRRRIPEHGRAALAVSGGVDSGYLAVQLVKAGAKVTAYNLSYGKSYSEVGRVEQLAKSVGFELRKMNLEEGEILENYVRANAVCSEPAGFNNATMGLLFAEAARDGHDTVFDGDGADRLFLGMNRHRQLKKLLGLYRRLSGLGLASPAAALLALLPHGDARKAATHFRNWERGILPYAERAMSASGDYDAAFERRLYDMAIGEMREGFSREIEGQQGNAELFFTYQGIRMTPEMFFYDPFDLESALGMCPVPAFWSDETVSLALSIPVSLKLRGKYTKYILREAAARHFEAGYWRLPKIGLQNSFAFATAGREGKEWLHERRIVAETSPEYELLDGLLGGAAVETDRLLGAVNWREYNGDAAALIF